MYFYVTFYEKIKILTNFYNNRIVLNDVYYVGYIMIYSFIFSMISFALFLS